MKDLIKNRNYNFRQAMGLKSMACLILLLLILLLPFSPAFFANAADDEKNPQSLEKQNLLAGLYEADITKLHNAILNGDITCRELCEYYLERIGEYNDDYNCFITLCDNALEQADKRDEELKSGVSDDKAKNLLFGVPVVIKDNMDYKGFPTTNGSSKKSADIADENAEAVGLLINSGAVILGKTNMSTQAQSASDSISVAVGETKNAYSVKLSSGGSSGGTASAVSLNFAAAGLGTDTNSSLRIPAAFNGDVALRPTFGLVSTDGCVRLNKRRDVVGAITRTVKDTAIMMDVLTQGEYSYAKNLTDNALDGVRLGVLKELTYPDDKHIHSEQTDKEITAAFNNAVDELKANGAEIIEVSIPKIFDYRDDCNETNPDASNIKKKYYSVFSDLLKDQNIDAVIFPTYLSKPLSSGVDDDGESIASSQTFINNCYYVAPILGIPEITVQIGRHSLGAGIGMEIASLKNSEQLLLNIAYSYEGKNNHRQAPDNAPSLYELSVPAVAPETASKAEDKSDASENSADDSSGEEKTNFAEYLYKGVLIFLRLAIFLLAIFLISVLVSTKRHRKKYRHKRTSRYRKSNAGRDRNRGRSKNKSKSKSQSRRRIDDEDDDEFDGDEIPSIKSRNRKRRVSSSSRSRQPQSRNRKSRDRSRNQNHSGSARGRNRGRNSRDRSHRPRRPIDEIDE